MSEGLKYDDAKPPMDLLDSDFLAGVANVLGYGAKKYTRDGVSGAHNWRNGLQYSRLIAAIYRHLGAINKGEDLDPESGLPHVYHLGCTVMFLGSMMQERPDMDDRHKAEPVRFMKVRPPIEIDDKKTSNKYKYATIRDIPSHTVGDL